MTNNVKKFYTTKFPTDEIGETLNPDITFEDVMGCLICGEGDNLYNLLGGDADSIVRERIFEALATRYEVDYDIIYELWIYRDSKIFDFAT